MLSEKFTVNGLATGKSRVDVVPISNISFAEFPAEVDFLAMVKSGEIHQTGVDIFQETADLFKLFKRRLETSSGRVFPVPQLADLVAWRDHASRNGDALKASMELCLGPLIVFSQLKQAAQEALDLWNETFGLEHGEEAGHLTIDDFRREYSSEMDYHLHMLVTCALASIPQPQARWSVRQLKRPNWERIRSRSSRRVRACGGPEDRILSTFGF